MTAPKTVTVKRIRLDYATIKDCCFPPEPDYRPPICYREDNKRVLDVITIWHPDNAEVFNSVGVGDAVQIDGYRIEPGDNGCEVLGALRLGFGRLKYATTSMILLSNTLNFIIDEAIVTGTTHLSGCRNLVKDRARIHDSRLNGGCLVEDEATLVGAKVQDSEIGGHAHVINSVLDQVSMCSRAKVNNVHANRAHILNSIEIDASALPNGWLDVCKPAWDEWVIPGNMCGGSYSEKITRRKLKRNLQAFKILKRDVFPYLPYIRACFDSENHRNQTERCHCLIWLPLILSFSPLALHYLMRVSGDTPIITNGDSDFLKDVRERVRDTSFNNPLSSIPLRDLEAMLEQEYKEYVKQIDSGWRLPLYLKMLGVTDDELKVYKGIFRDELSREAYAHLFQYVTGIRLGDIRLTSKI